MEEKAPATDAEESLRERKPSGLSIDEDHFRSFRDGPAIRLRFDKRIDGYTKVLIRFGESKKSKASAA